MPRRTRSDSIANMIKDRMVTKIDLRTRNSEGTRLCQLNQHKKAIRNYNQVLIDCETDMVALCGRSQCLVKQGDAIGAVVDSENALAQNKKFDLALLRKAEAHYIHGDLENALIYFYRGYSIRPNKEIFKDGIRKCISSILGCVGDARKVAITTEGLDNLSELKPLERPKPRRGITGISSKLMKSEFGVFSLTNLLLAAVLKEMRVPKVGGNSKVLHEILEELNADRLFLEDLVAKCDVYKTPERNTYNIICDSLDYMDKKRSFWQQSKPLYVRCWEMDEKMSSNGKAESVSKKTIDNKIRIVENEIEKMSYELTNGYLKECVERGERILKTLKIFTAAGKRNRLELMATTHSFIGYAFFDLKDYKQALLHHGKDYDLSMEIDHPKNISRAIDNLGQVLARVGKYKKAIDMWSTKLEKQKTPLEATWLYHEIGRCYMKLENCQKSLEYAKKSVGAALKCGDLLWSMNATILVAESELCLGRLQESMDNFHLALDCAYRVKHSKAVMIIRQAVKKIQDKLDNKPVMTTAKRSSFKVDSKTKLKGDFDQKMYSRQKIRAMNIQEKKIFSDICGDMTFNIMRHVADEANLHGRPAKMADEYAEFISRLFGELDAIVSSKELAAANNGQHFKTETLSKFIVSKSEQIHELVSAIKAEYVDNLCTLIVGLVEATNEKKFVDDEHENVTKSTILKIIAYGSKNLSKVFKLKNHDLVVSKAANQIIKICSTESQSIFNNNMKSSNTTAAAAASSLKKTQRNDDAAATEFKNVLEKSGKEVSEFIFREVVESEGNKAVEQLLQYGFSIAGDIVKDINNEVNTVYDPLIHQIVSQPGSENIVRNLLLKILSDINSGGDTEENLKEISKGCFNLVCTEFVEIVTDLTHSFSTINHAEQRHQTMNVIANQLAEFLIVEVASKISSAEEANLERGERTCHVKNVMERLTKRMFVRVANSLGMDVTANNSIMEFLFRIGDCISQKLNIIEGCKDEKNTKNVKEIVKCFTSDILQRAIKLLMEEQRNVINALDKQDQIDDVAANLVETIVSSVATKVFVDEGADTTSNQTIRNFSQDIVLKIVFEAATKISQDFNEIEGDVFKKMQTKSKKILSGWQGKLRRELKDLISEIKSNLVVLPSQQKIAFDSEKMGDDLSKKKQQQQSSRKSVTDSKPVISLVGKAIDKVQESGSLHKSMASTSKKQQQQSTTTASQTKLKQMKEKLEENSKSRKSLEVSERKLSKKELTTLKETDYKARKLLAGLLVSEAVANRKYLLKSKDEDNTLATQMVKAVISDSLSRVMNEDAELIYGHVSDTLANRFVIDILDDDIQLPDDDDDDNDNAVNKALTLAEAVIEKEIARHSSDAAYKACIENFPNIDMRTAAFNVIELIINNEMPDINTLSSSDNNKMVDEEEKNNFSPESLKRPPPRESTTRAEPRVVDSMNVTSHLDQTTDAMRAGSTTNKKTTPNSKTTLTKFADSAASSKVPISTLPEEDDRMHDPLPPPPIDGGGGGKKTAFVRTSIKSKSLFGKNVVDDKKKKSFSKDGGENNFGSSGSGIEKKVLTRTPKEKKLSRQKSGKGRMDSGLGGSLGSGSRFTTSSSSSVDKKDHVAKSSDVDVSKKTHSADYISRQTHSGSKLVTKTGEKKASKSGSGSSNNTRSSDVDDIGNRKKEKKQVKHDGSNKDSKKSKTLLDNDEKIPVQTESDIVRNDMATRIVKDSIESAARVVYEDLIKESDNVNKDVNKISSKSSHLVKDHSVDSNENLQPSNRKSDKNIMEEKMSQKSLKNVAVAQSSKLVAQSEDVNTSEVKYGYPSNNNIGRSIDSNNNLQTMKSTGKELSDVSETSIPFGYPAKTAGGGGNIDDNQTQILKGGKIVSGGDSKLSRNLPPTVSERTISSLKRLGGSIEKNKNKAHDDNQATVVGGGGGNEQVTFLQEKDDGGELVSKGKPDESSKQKGELFKGDDDKKSIASSKHNLPTSKAASIKQSSLHEKDIDKNKQIDDSSLNHNEAIALEKDADFRKKLTESAIGVAASSLLKPDEQADVEGKSPDNNEESAFMDNGGSEAVVEWPKSIRYSNKVMTDVELNKLNEGGELDKIVTPPPSIKDKSSDRLIVDDHKDNDNLPINDEDIDMKLNESNSEVSYDYHNKHFKQEKKKSETDYNLRSVKEKSATIDDLVKDTASGMISSKKGSIVENQKSKSKSGDKLVNVSRKASILNDGSIKETVLADGSIVKETVSQDGSKKETHLPDGSIIKETVLKDGSIKETVLADGSIIKQTVSQDGSKKETVLADGSVIKETVSQDGSKKETVLPDGSIIKETVSHQDSIKQTVLPDGSIKEIVLPKGSIIKETKSPNGSIKETVIIDGSRKASLLADGSRKGSLKKESSLHNTESTLLSLDNKSNMIVGQDIEREVDMTRASTAVSSVKKIDEILENMEAIDDGKLSVIKSENRSVVAPLPPPPNETLTARPSFEKVFPDVPKDSPLHTSIKIDKDHQQDGNLQQQHDDEDLQQQPEGTIYQTRHYGLAKILDKPNEMSTTSDYKTAKDCNGDSRLSVTPVVFDSRNVTPFSTKENRKENNKGGVVAANSPIIGKDGELNLEAVVSGNEERSGAAAAAESDRKLNVEKRRKNNNNNDDDSRNGGMAAANSTSRSLKSRASYASSYGGEEERDDSCDLTSEQDEFDRLEMTLNSSLTSSTPILGSNLSNDDNDDHHNNLMGEFRPVILNSNDTDICMEDGLDQQNDILMEHLSNRRNTEKYLDDNDYDDGGADDKNNDRVSDYQVYNVERDDRSRAAAATVDRYSHASYISDNFMDDGNCTGRQSYESVSFVDGDALKRTVKKSDSDKYSDGNDDDNNDDDDDDDDVESNDNDNYDESNDNANEDDDVEISNERNYDNGGRMADRYELKDGRNDRYNYESDDDDRNNHEVDNGDKKDYESDEIDDKTKDDEGFNSNKAKFLNATDISNEIDNEKTVNESLRLENVCKSSNESSGSEDEDDDDDEDSDSESLSTMREEKTIDDGNKTECDEDCDNYEKEAETEETSANYEKMSLTNDRCKYNDGGRRVTIDEDAKWIDNENWIDNKIEEVVNYNKDCSDISVVNETSKSSNSIEKSVNSEEKCQVGVDNNIVTNVTNEMDDFCCEMQEDNDDDDECDSPTICQDESTFEKEMCDEDCCEYDENNNDCIDEENNKNVECEEVECDEIIIDEQSNKTEPKEPFEASSSSTSKKDYYAASSVDESPENSQCHERITKKECYDRYGKTYCKKVFEDKKTSKCQYKKSKLSDPSISLGEGNEEVVVHIDTNSPSFFDNDDDNDDDDDAMADCSICEIKPKQQEAGKLDPGLVDDSCDDMFGVERSDSSEAASGDKWSKDDCEKKNNSGSAAGNGGDSCQFDDFDVVSSAAASGGKNKNNQFEAKSQSNSLMTTDDDDDEFSDSGRDNETVNISKSNSAAGGGVVAVNNKASTCSNRTDVVFSSTSTSSNCGMECDSTEDEGSLV